jgi:hypothetical protein
MIHGAKKEAQILFLSLSIPKIGVVVSVGAALHYRYVSGFAKMMQLRDNI